MDARFLLGPAGSGKTFRCLLEIRDRLLADPLGPPLVLIAPRQATYQLELQLLSDSVLQGYSRLQIVSFERLASWLIEQLEINPDRLLSEEGRVMVLRAILHQHHDQLQSFGQSGRSPGFADLLSGQLRELQQYCVSPDQLRKTAERLPADDDLHKKLNDLALMLEHYRDWLEKEHVGDAGTQLDQLVNSLQEHSPQILIDELWLDGVAELTPQELELIAGLAPFVRKATFAFCLEAEPVADPPWLSTWSVIGQTFRKLHSRLNAIDDCQITVEQIQRAATRNRFHRAKKNGSPENVQMDLFTSNKNQPRSPKADSPFLNHLENAWTSGTPSNTQSSELRHELTLSKCPGPEQEAALAAREFLRFVQAGNRYRDCAVLLRHLDTHAASLRRVFTRYQIPFFMDRRESVAHHPLAELTRSALLTVLYNWRFTDWFGALKSGLTSLNEDEVDRLETVALANGWEGNCWLKELKSNDQNKAASTSERMRKRIIVPFEKLRQNLHGEVNGRQLAKAVHDLWAQLDVEATLQSWSEESGNGAAHLTVLEEMDGWLENLELAFSNWAMPLREWMPILDAGLGTLSVGAIPPAIDQVVIGAVDRSRNPDLKLAVVLGLNEGIFPQPVSENSLLSESDRLKLDGTPAELRGDHKLRIGHERFLGYIALTRAHERLIISFSERDATGKPLNASPLVDHLKRLFPTLETDTFRGDIELGDCVHESELLTPFLAKRSNITVPETINRRVEHFQSFERGAKTDHLKSETVELLHGNRLRTSASRLENFAACPFQYFVNASLRAHERDRFEVDARKTGTFLHEVLRHFQLELEHEELNWRDATPDNARERIGRIAKQQASHVAGGVLNSGARNAFQLESATRLLQDFVVQTIEWMRTYKFDPIAVELSVGGDQAELPWWEIPLNGDRSLAFRGQVDRVDAAVPSESEGEVCLNVLDYKSGQKKFSAWEMQAGLQLQLPAYLAALTVLAKEYSKLKGRTARPTGMFYVRLRNSEQRSKSRDADSGKPTKPFEHTGRFSFDFLSLFDSDHTSGSSGQFSYRLKNDGTPYANSQELVSQEALTGIVRDAEDMLRVMGDQIMDGNIAVDPYRKGTQLPCSFCEHKSICRIDPWTHAYRSPRPLLETPPVE